MIINIFDMRADHMAVDPVDAAILGYESRVDRNGVIIADVSWDSPYLRKDISITSAIEWASLVQEKVNLILFDAESRASRLAELRMDIKGSAERILLRLAIKPPTSEVNFIESKKI